MRSDVLELFRFHPPTPEKIETHRSVDEQTALLALWLHDNLPPSPETTLAIRAVHQARFHANTAIAVRS